MIPVPKVKQLNFHGITLSSVLGKLFNLIILDIKQETHCTFDLKFGFKADVSSTQWQMFLKKL